MREDVEGRELIRHRLRVRWVDTDASGRIHNTAALRYFEEAESELFRALGGRVEAQLAGYDFPRVHVECDFLLPLGYDDEIEVAAHLLRLGRTSFTLGYTGTLVASGPYEPLLTAGRPRPRPAEALRGHVVIVCVDTRTGQPAPLPDDLRARLQAEGGAGWT